jgi:hypothetical protein
VESFECVARMSEARCGKPENQKTRMSLRSSGLRLLTLSSRSMKRLSPREFWDEILMISTFVWIKKRIQTKVVFY